jgi:hypothetical protein
MCDYLDEERKERCGTEWPEFKYSEGGHASLHVTRTQLPCNTVYIIIIVLKY